MKTLPKRVSTPDAFKQKFMPIVEANEFTPMAAIRPNVKVYAMGRIRAIYAPKTDNYPEILSVSHDKRYPTWDEIVWLRYQLCSPDSDMALILPPLGDYINYDGGRGRNTFTLEGIYYRGLEKGTSE